MYDKIARTVAVLDGLYCAVKKGVVRLKYEQYAIIIRIECEG